MTPIQSTSGFQGLGLAPKLLEILHNKGFKIPTPIQQQAIPVAVLGKDIMGIAQTGTGKTLAFGLPMLQTIAKTKTLGLVVLPTRELALQVNEALENIGKSFGLKTAVLIGGESMHKQLMNLRRHPHIIIATPGRLIDHLEQKTARLDKVGILVLDEADRMLDMGFSKDINFLVDALPDKRQTLCFSATMTNTVEQLVAKMMHEYVTISVCAPVASTHIEQDVVRYDTPDQKLDLLVRMLTQEEYEKVLIFGETKHGVQRLSEKLSQNGISAEAIHGNKSQPQRQRALNAFKSNMVRALCATDVAARGLDIPNVSHVINFDQPNNYDDYIHRIGRTGRAGKQGCAYTFVANTVARY